MKTKRFYAMISILGLMLFAALGQAQAQSAPCENCKSYSGSLSGTEDAQTQPDGNYYESTSSGNHKSWLRGPAGADFDLYLWKWDGARWAFVAGFGYNTAGEKSYQFRCVYDGQRDQWPCYKEVSYYGEPGFYAWTVYSKAGRGAYTLWLQTPSGKQTNQVTLTATPNSVAPGGRITVSFNAPGRQGRKDWVGLFTAGAPDTNFLAYGWTDGLASGSFNFTAPGQTGQYEFRYFVDNSYTLIARSNTVQVGAATTASLTATPSSVAPGGQVTVNFTTTTPQSLDWIGLFSMGAADTSYVTYQMTQGRSSGNLTFTMPSQTGQYEFRYLLNNGYTSVARSSTVQVSSGTGQTGPANSQIEQFSWVKEKGHFSLTLNLSSATEIKSIKITACGGSTNFATDNHFPLGVFKDGIGSDLTGGLRVPTLGQFSGRVTFDLRSGAFTGNLFPPSGVILEVTLSNGQTLKGETSVE